MSNHDYYEFIFFKDLRRCPFKWGTVECGEWNEKEAVRLHQLAISRGWKPLEHKSTQENHGKDSTRKG